MLQNCKLQSCKVAKLQSREGGGVRVAKKSKNCEHEKSPPRCCFCGTTEWENINKKSRESLSTLLTAYQIYKGNSTKIQRKLEDEGKMPFWALKRILSKISYGYLDSLTHNSSFETHNGIYTHLYVVTQHWPNMS